jgi:putative flippase GtrA
MIRLSRRRGVRYVVIGVWNMVFGLIVFTVLEKTVSDEIGYITTLIAAQAVAVVQAHASQRMLVWRSAAHYLPELLRFSTIYVVVLLLNIVLLSALVEGAGTPVLLSQYVIGGALILAAYVAQRHWAFAAGLDRRLKAEQPGNHGTGLESEFANDTAQGDRS